MCRKFNHNNSIIQIFLKLFLAVPIFTNIYLLALRMLDEVELGPEMSMLLSTFLP